MKKKISIEKYLDLEKRDREELNYYQKELSKVQEENIHLRNLIRVVRGKKINLEELERLGLHRYNAKYGKRGSFQNHHWLRPLEETTYVSDLLYEKLKEYQFIYVEILPRGT